MALSRFRATRMLLTYRTFYTSRAVLSSNDAVAVTPFKVEDKCAIINGGASGIGLAVAREFLKGGMQSLAIIDIDGDKAEKVAENLNKEFGDEKVIFFEADVANSKQLDAAYRRAIQFFDMMQIVVNSAGIMNDTTWERQIQTNLSGCLIGTLLGMQYMSKSSNGDGGIVVNVSSILALLPSCGYPLHTMTQFGICGFSRALGLGEHFKRTGVNIMAVCPDLTDTALIAEAPKHAINEHFTKEFLGELEGAELQKPEIIAKGIMGVLCKAQPGSIWMIQKEGKHYEVNYPNVDLKLDEDVTSKTEKDVVSQKE